MAVIKHVTLPIALTPLDFIAILKSLNAYIDIIIFVQDVFLPHIDKILLLHYMYCKLLIFHILSYCNLFVVLV